MNYVAIMDNYLNTNYISFRRRFSTLRSENKNYDREYDKHIILDFTKPAVEVPADMMYAVMDLNAYIYNKVFLYPILFDKRYIRKVQAGNSIVWTALDKARCWYNIPVDRQMLSRCFVIDTGNNKKVYAAPGLLLDSNGEGLYRIVTRMNRDEDFGKYRPSSTVLYLNPKVFLEETPVNKAIVKYMVPAFLQCSQHYPNTMATTPLVEVKEFDSFSYTGVPRPKSLETMNEDLNECLLNHVNIFEGYGR